MPSFMKQKKVVALAAVIMAGVSVAAYAYFTTTGTGSGSASTGSATNWTLGQTGSTGGALYPDAAIGGANIQTKSYSVTNPGSGSQSLAKVVIKVDPTFAAQSDPLKPACTASDFSVGGAAVGQPYTDTALAGTFTAGQTKTTGSFTVEMIDNGLNQDNCQGLTSVPLVLTAS